jgi:hypothetical protein
MMASSWGPRAGERLEAPGNAAVGDLAQEWKAARGLCLAETDRGSVHTSERLEPRPAKTAARPTHKHREP